MPGYDKYIDKLFDPRAARVVKKRLVKYTASLSDYPTKEYHAQQLRRYLKNDKLLEQVWIAYQCWRDFDAIAAGPKATIHFINSEPAER